MCICLRPWFLSLAEIDICSSGRDVSGTDAILSSRLRRTFGPAFWSSPRWAAHSRLPLWASCSSAYIPLQPILLSLSSPLVLGYLDDISLGGNAEVVARYVAV